jgi:hypothetical protein
MRFFGWIAKAKTDPYGMTNNRQATVTAAAAATNLDLGLERDECLI